MRNHATRMTDIDGVALEKNNVRTLHSFNALVRHADAVMCDIGDQRVAYVPTRL